MADLDFYFDPVCPFAWVTSRWVVRVAELRSVQVAWRFISLRLVNAERDYDKEFPPGYVDGHTRGLELLRVAAATRAGHGNDGVGRLYGAYGAAIWDAPGGLEARLRQRGDLASVEPVLADAELPVELARAVGDDTWDEVIRSETDQALARTGKDVGTPIVTFDPPDGLSLFGPVISRVPGDDDAVALWEAVSTLARIEGFAELKRSLRAPLDLAALRR